MLMHSYEQEKINSYAKFYLELITITVITFLIELTAMIAAAVLATLAALQIFRIILMHLHQMLHDLKKKHVIIIIIN